MVHQKGRKKTMKDINRKKREREREREREKENK
jgi:hypothetical protein